ncbi:MULTISPECIES: hypothetical protein [unclassified Streptomyces]|uniref:hypothetical protein n=1 Tax=unclassified Streptomyces TaxID=2593676 RepID=UPI00190DDB7C|nr:MULTISPECIES: hypothetical protein [unclassified Streptomyces]MBK3571556.1 hypothetical protein [Streptomyces sp. MBT62]MBK6012469.1 hypothetical protein [Streptomyces sp. MBT53]
MKTSQGCNKWQGLSSCVPTAEEFGSIGMESLIAFLPCGVTVEDVRDRLLERGGNVDIRDGRIFVSHEGSVAWIESGVEDELKSEYESDELVLIEGLIGSWTAFVIDYRSMGVADFAVAALCGRWPCVVDDDAGFIGWGAEYLAHRPH